MIRAIALILGLTLGLALALLVGGTLGHLRLILPQTGLTLPEWVAGLEDDSRVAQGRGSLNGAALHWRLTGREGFAVSLSGADWQARGQALPPGAALRIGQLSGVIPLAYLDAGPGLLALAGGEVTLAPDGTLRSGRIEGTARGSEPDGAVALVWNDGWQLISR